ncbi:hypothetical protein CYMTET_20431 [Cymbomonas tetramitiformis]|uniref:Uncharacterized protein n=1 Tax=Cymbomonas tetramitiformis TaxID=36881 RepID=A0AAE0G4B5_9CHLO|nr:hypothetical protein CYMTET_20431 [Cymbomonas tetramitiformis]
MGMRGKRGRKKRSGSESKAQVTTEPSTFQAGNHHTTHSNARSSAKAPPSADTVAALDSHPIHIRGSDPGEARAEPSAKRSSWRGISEAVRGDAKGLLKIQRIEKYFERGHLTSTQDQLGSQQELSVHHPPPEDLFDRGAAGKAAVAWKAINHVGPDFALCMPRDGPEFRDKAEEAGSHILHSLRNYVSLG